MPNQYGFAVDCSQMIRFSIIAFQFLTSCDVRSIYAARNLVASYVYKEIFVSMTRSK